MTDSALPRADLRLLLCGDLHGHESGLDWLEQLAASEKPDVLLFIGDFITGEPVQFLRECLRAMRPLAKHVLVIPGNWDPRDSLLYFDEEAMDGLLNLHRNSAFINGWSFAGLGGSTITPAGKSPFEDLDEGFADPLAANLPADVWVLHNPLKGRLDATGNGRAAGSESLAQLWTEQDEKPRLIVSGHIHEAHGDTAEQGTTFVNAGPLFENRATRIMLSADSVIVEHIRG